MIRIAVTLALAAAAPVFAQTAPAAPPVVAVQPVDPARLAARPVVERLWPLGTYRKMMDEAMGKMMDAMMAQMFEMPAKDFAAGIDPSGEAGKALEGKSMGELAAIGDPHFRERMSITTRVMNAEMAPMFERVEPTVRESLARIYARRFTAAQLGELAGFFATPTGKAYAEQSMLVYVDPEMIAGMQAFMPELMKAMPGMMAKIEKSTAHLPPPAKPSGDSESEAGDGPDVSS